MAKIGIGLDMGTSAIKLVELQGDKEIRINRLGLIPLKSGAVCAGEIVDLAEVSEAVLSLIQQQGIQFKRMVIAVAGQAAIVRLFKIALQNKKELADIVKKEAERNLPYTLDELYTDFQIIGEDNQANEMEVLLVGARRSTIDSQLEVLKAVGVQPVAVDIQSLALIRAVGYENEETSSKYRFFGYR